MGTGTTSRPTPIRRVSTPTDRHDPARSSSGARTPMSWLTARAHRAGRSQWRDRRGFTPRSTPSDPAMLSHRAGNVRATAADPSYTLAVVLRHVGPSFGRVIHRVLRREHPLLTSAATRPTYCDQVTAR